MTRIYQQYQSRIAVLSLVVIFAWGGLGLRLFNIQVINGKKYHEQGNRQGQTKEIIPALRGDILDKNGVPLTRNIIHYTIAADPTQVNNKQSIARELSKATGKSTKNYLKKLSKNNNFVYLERNLKKRDAQSIIDKNYEGLIIQRHASRTYPQDNIGGQLIGFTNVDNKGLIGIENIYDKYLSGTDGWIIKQRSGLGAVNLKNSYPKKNPVDGSDVSLTINIDYQSVLQEELAKQVKTTNAIGGTGVIVNPQTGAILAMASVPDFNPNKPNKFATENQKNRAITDQFEPGSTFKVIAATAAIDNNLVKIEDEFDCENGSFKYKNITIGDHIPHGILTFGEIIEQSSNIGIIKVASVVGEKLLYKYAREYGFGSPTNIGIGSESSGTLRKLSDWSKISLAEIAMGHEVGINALQLAMAYSAIANGGILLKPFILTNIKNSEGQTVHTDQPAVVRKVVDKNVMKILSHQLEKVVESGTGKNAKISGWQVAGKTGTAQKIVDGKYSHTKFVSNFVGYLPASNPQLLCVILIDEPRMGYHWGSTGSAPVFKKVMERIININDSIQTPKTEILDIEMPQPILVEKKLKKPNRKIINEPILLSSIAKEPVQSPPAQSDQSLNLGNTVVPNVKGMSLKKAINTINDSGLRSKFIGSGLVVWQSPKPGTKINAGTICSIGLE